MQLIDARGPQECRRMRGQSPREEWATTLGKYGACRRDYYSTDTECVARDPEILAQAFWLKHFGSSIAFGLNILPIYTRSHLI